MQEQFSAVMYAFDLKILKRWDQSSLLVRTVETFDAVVVVVVGVVAPRDEAFRCALTSLYGLLAFKVKSRHILCLICGSTVPVFAPAGLIAQ
ncbi:hypothetical protein [Marinobacterium sedimentorum]|uniref:hypothetical protein n=1 Tax=Marinobacterium sedimentorum TaxID=2927804 RepID=UPI0020C60274|nr:hypothetical protein [Marinobacterium sedimentorum]MCP8688041.1 hypothetical protein [Marinobacterium sedimentorum]